jgi:hypothetical protein
MLINWNRIRFGYRKWSNFNKVLIIFLYLNLNIDNTKLHAWESIIIPNFETHKKDKMDRYLVSIFGFF